MLLYTVSTDCIANIHSSSAEVSAVSVKSLVETKEEVQTGGVGRVL